MTTGHQSKRFSAGLSAMVLTMTVSYTPNLMDYLAQQNLKATLFVVGSRVLERPKLLQDMYMNGHQIAVHTWSHHYLVNMTNEQVIAELGWSRKIIKDVLGVTPNFWRPPFGDIEWVLCADTS
jgi:peptidoglycan/xylan/chitin deacetylase (PgdA/CDA1 family)